MRLQPTTVAVVFIDQNDHGALTAWTASADPLNSRGKFSDGDDGRLPRRLHRAWRARSVRLSWRCSSLADVHAHGQLKGLASAVWRLRQGRRRLWLSG